MKRPFMVWISFISICCSKVAKEGKSCPRLLVLQRVAQNAKSCSKVAEHNLFMPSAYARRRRRRRRPRSCLTWRPNNRVTEPCSLSLPCTSLTLDSHAMINWHLLNTRYPLTSIMLPYRGLKCTAHRVRMFLWSWPLNKCWFSHWIAGSCEVYLQGRIVL